MAKRDVDALLPPPKRSKLMSEKTDGSEKVIGRNQKQLKDAHIQVLLSLEYHGTNYGGWQRQGPKNNIKFPSVQGTLEQSSTQVCTNVANQSSWRLISTTETGDKVAIMAGSSGRTDRGVHALDHKCLLRLPFSKQNLSQVEDFLVGNSSSGESDSSPFLHALNASLPSDIHVLTCRIVTKHDRKRLRFGRRRYTYLIQQACGQLNRPWQAWNGYTYFVKQKLNVEKMQEALALMQGTHDFLPLSCQKGKPNTVRTLHKGAMTVVQHSFDSLAWFQRAFRPLKDANSSVDSCIFNPPNYGANVYPSPNANNNPQHQQLNPQDYQILQLDFEGSGFLRHQVRRMVSVVVKVGEGVWEPSIVHRILYQEKKFLQGRALAPGRALWKAKVWIDQQQHSIVQQNAGDNDDDDNALDEEDE